MRSFVSRASLVLLVISSSSALADPEEDPLCVRDGIVGDNGCRFGAWGQSLREPYLFVDFGMNWRHFASPSSGHMPSAAIARVASTTSPDMTSTGGAFGGGGTDTALEFDERVGVGLGHGLYVAVDLELGNFAWNDRSDSARDVVLVGTGAFGLRIGLGPLALSAEVGAGGMAYTFPSSTTFSTAAVVEGRGRAELWVSPWITLGAVAGTSIIRRDEWLLGAFIGFHTHAYAGDR